MARHGLRTRPPGGEPEAADGDEAEAADGDGRRTPSGPIPHHTHILLARVPDPYSPRHPRNGNCTHARRSEGPRHRSDGLHILTVCVGVVECAPASPYAYSSPSHRFPDERTPIEAMPLLATSAELGPPRDHGALHRHRHASATTLRFLSLSPRGILQWPEEQSRSGCGQDGGDADQSQHRRMWRCRSTEVGAPGTG